MIEDYCRCPGCGECNAHVNEPKLKSKIKKQAEELSALRGFAQAMYRRKNGMGFYIDDDLEQFNLTDENGNPTSLLTGGSE